MIWSIYGGGCIKTYVVIHSTYLVFREFLFFLLPGFKDAVVTCDMLKANENNDPSSKHLCRMRGIIGVSLRLEHVTTLPDVF